MEYCVDIEWYLFFVYVFDIGVIEEYGEFFRFFEVNIFRNGEFKKMG